jgi:hypothetical protein
MNDMTRRNDFYTVAEASDVLGRSVPTIYTWMKLSKLALQEKPGATKADGLQAGCSKTSRVDLVLV